MSVEGIPDPERAAVEAEIAAFEDASERQVSATVGPDGIRPEPRLNEYGVPSRDEVFGTAASPDERLREALRTMIDVYDRHDRWCGHYAQAPGDGIIHRIDGARNALAAADREAHLEPAPQNDATRAQIVAAKLIADREAPDEETR